MWPPDAARSLALPGRPDRRCAAAAAGRRDHPRKDFLRLHEELPYASTVETESWQERKDGSVRIDQVIYVERESQRKIVLGKNGQAIKEHRPGGARRDCRAARPAGAPVPVRQGPRHLGIRPRTAAPHGTGTAAAVRRMAPYGCFSACLLGRWRARARWPRRGAWPARPLPRHRGGHGVRPHR
jgi:hypothetical protein